MRGERPALIHCVSLTILLALAAALLALGPRGLRNDWSQTFPRPSRALTSPDAARPQIVADYGKLPLSFEANQGQADPQVKFLSRGQGYSLFLTPTEAVLQLRIPTQPGQVTDFGLRNEDQKHLRGWGSNPDSAFRNPHSAAVSEVNLRLRLVGANRSPRIRGLEELPGKSNYFIGNDPSKWRTNIPTYGKIEYRDVYPGVNLVYYGNGRQLEHDFVVAPGARPERVRFTVEGAETLEVDGQGDLVLHMSGRDVRFQKPLVYQESGGVRRHVAGGFTLHGSHQVGFEVAAYDDTRPLLIDPVLRYSTYLGGNWYSSGSSIAVDSSGNAYVTGYTGSTNFPTANPSQGTRGGDGDAFVAKLNAAGTALVYSTYLGGNGGDNGEGIAVDSSGNAYVTGSTSSTNLPTVNPLQASSGGDGDAFVAKLNAAGSALVYSTYLGGSAVDYGFGIVVDSAGNAYVTGLTRSTNFPTASPFQASNAGGYWDVFVAKLNAAGSALVYSTYLGGSGDDCGYGIAVDSSGNAYVTGNTSSTHFPVVNPLQASNRGAAVNAFVAKLNATGSALVYSTYLGQMDEGNSIAVDSAGNAYVTGDTSSTDFPTANALQATYGGNGDAFVAKLNATGSALVYSTYLGGNGGDNGEGIAVDSSGNAYVTGYTGSTNFPTANPSQVTCGGQEDAFVAKLNAAGSALVYSTYLGGSGHDRAAGIAVDSSGNAYVTGYTGSPNFPTVNSLQASHGGVEDGFIVQIDTVAPMCVDLSITPASAALTAGGGTGAVAVTALPGCAWTAVSNASWITITAGSGSGNGTVSYVVAANSSGLSRSWTFTIAGQRFTVNQAGVSCSYAVTPVNASVPTSAGTGSVTVVAPTGCRWTAASGASWITITSGSSGSGNGTVSYSVAANTGTASRTGTLTIGGNTFTLTQEGLPCSYALSRSSDTLTASGRDGFVGVTTTSGCAWTANSSVGWITITAGSGSGNGGVYYSVAENGSVNSRTGTLTIAGLIFTVTQAGAPCPYAISPASGSFSASGGTGSITVPAPTDCTWAARSNVSWIAITAGSSASGNGTVSYSVAAHTSSIVARTGTVTIGGQTFTVRQAGAPCTYIVVPANQSFLAIGGFGSVAVTALPGCAWTAVSNASWITITSGASGNGSGPVTYSVAPYTDAPTRSGLMLIGGQLFTVTQAGSAASFPVVPAGGTVNGANFSSSVPGGSIGSLFGTNLALSQSFGSSLPLPTTLGGATVQIDGIPAPLFYVSPAQINFQMPWQLLGQSQASITVTVGGLTSAPQAINIAAFAPGLFAMNSQGTGQGAVLIAATGEIAAPLGSIAGRATRPVQRGEYLSIYCTGLGPVANQPVNGAASPANPLPMTINTPAVTIGAVTATVGFSGLGPNFVGLYQVNVQVADNTPTGGAVPVTLTIGGVTSNTVTIAVQ